MAPAPVAPSSTVFQLRPDLSHPPKAHEAGAPRAAAGDRPREDELAALLAQIRGHNEGALEQLFRATQRAVHALVLRLVGDEQTSEEVTLDVYMQVWRQAQAFDVARGSPSSWLMTIARSRALDRRRAREVRALWDQALPHAAGDAPQYGVSLSGARASVQRQPHECAGLDVDVSAAYCALEDAGRLQAALQKLESEQEIAIRLAFFDGYSHSEIAMKLGQPLGTVKTRIRRGLLRMARILEDQERST